MVRKHVGRWSVDASRPSAAAPWLKRSVGDATNFKKKKYVRSFGEKPRAPPAGGRRGQVELLAHAYATCAVMSGLDKGP